MKLFKFVSIFTIWSLFVFAIYFALSNISNIIDIDFAKGLLGVFVLINSLAATYHLIDITKIIYNIERKKHVSK